MVTKHEFELSGQTVAIKTPRNFPIKNFPYQLYMATCKYCYLTRKEHDREQRKLARTNRETATETP